MFGVIRTVGVVTFALNATGCVLTFVMFIEHLGRRLSGPAIIDTWFQGRIREKMCLRLKHMASLGSRVTDIEVVGVCVIALLELNIDKHYLRSEGTMQVHLALSMYKMDSAI